MRYHLDQLFAQANVLGITQLMGIRQLILRCITYHNKIKYKSFLPQHNYSTRQNGFIIVY